MCSKTLVHLFDKYEVALLALGESWININEVEDSAIAKSTRKQDEKDMATKDSVLFGVLSSKRKASKSEASYREQESSSPETDCKCAKCKFNLGDEKKCHIVGEITNNGISKFLSSKGDGMLPGKYCMGFHKKRQEENLITRKDMSSTRVQLGSNAKIANTTCIRKIAS